MPKPPFRDSEIDPARKKWIELVFPYAEYILHALRATPWASFQTQMQDYTLFAFFPVENKSEESNYQDFLYDPEIKLFQVTHHTAHQEVQATAFIDRHKEVPSPIHVYDEDVVVGEDEKVKEEFRGKDYYQVIGGGDDRTIFKFVTYTMKFSATTPFLLVGGCCLELYAFALDTALGVNIRDFVDTTADIDVHVFIDDHNNSYDDEYLLEKAKAFIHTNFTGPITPLLEQIGDLKVDDSNAVHYQYELTYPKRSDGPGEAHFSDHILDIVVIVLGDTPPPDAMVLGGYPLRNLWMEAQRGFLRTVEEKGEMTPTKYAITQRRFKYIITLLWKIYHPANAEHPTCAQLRKSVQPKTIQTFWALVWDNPNLHPFFDVKSFLLEEGNEVVERSIKSTYVRP